MKTKKKETVFPVFQILSNEPTKEVHEFPLCCAEGSQTPLAPHGAGKDYWKEISQSRSGAHPVLQILNAKVGA